MARGLNRHGFRGCCPGGVALRQQFLDIAVVGLLGEQVAALPTLAPIVFAADAVEIVGPGFGGDRGTETGGVTKTAVKRVIEDLGLGNGIDGGQVGTVSSVAIAEGAVNRPDVAAYAAAVRVIGTALGGMRSQK